MRLIKKEEWIAIVVGIAVIVIFMASGSLFMNQIDNIADNFEDVSNNSLSAAGLSIDIVAQGTGERELAHGDVVTVHYVGKLEDGRAFDSSYLRGEPFTFTLGAGQVIVGWEVGLVGMQVGEKRVITIPSEMAYGERGVGDVIPPNATLIFEVELVKIGE